MCVYARLCTLSLETRGVRSPELELQVVMLGIEPRSHGKAVYALNPELSFQSQDIVLIHFMLISFRQAFVVYKDVILAIFSHNSFVWDLTLMLAYCLL